ncbi:MAG TPA: hypothetical protein VL651_11490 [Bacteroidia bacterium]|jgi:antitoxin component YwqK of YwqJK toxin-antitoxin module|nr:hypothetical protein [Bacteroidia bacterium]
MKNTFLLFSLLLALSSAAQSDTLNRVDSAGKRQGYWIVIGKMRNDRNFSDSAKVEEGNYVNSMKTGLWISYFPSGVKQMELTYVNNRPNGHCVMYYEDGNKEEEGTWQGNRWVGDYHLYNDSAGNAERTQFKYNSTGQRDGTQVYPEHGQVQIEFHWPNPDSINLTDSAGRKQGYWIITGKLKNDMAYRPDSKVEEGNYLDGKKTGTWISYYPTGIVHISVPYVNGRINGYAYIYNDRGHLEEEGTWQGTRWIGEYKQYYENDSLHLHFFYNKLGQRDGVQHYYYPNGKEMATSICNAGKEDNWQMEYFDDGTLYRKTFYDNGVIDASKTWQKPGASNPQENPDQTRYNSANSNAGIDWGEAVLMKDGKISMRGTFKDYKLVDGEERIYDVSGNLIQRKAFRNGEYYGDVPLEE